MKKATLYTLLTCFAFVAHSQNISGLFNPNERLTWLGVDYSHVKLIGEFSQFAGLGDVSVDEIQSNYFNSWNMLYVTESDVYNLQKAFNKTDIYKDIDSVMELNLAVSSSELTSYNVPRYQPADIQKFVNQYALQGKTGLAAVLIAEAIDKGAEMAYFHLAIIDMASGKVLLTERFEGKPRGFGIRNYWAGSMRDVLAEIEKKMKKEWKKAYGGK